MAHVYQIRGGSLRVAIFQPNNQKRVSFSFYVFDQKSKIVAYCWFTADGSDQLAESDRNSIRQVGVGGRPGQASLTKPLDLVHLEKTKWTLTIAKNPDDANAGTATLLLDKDAVMLEFPIVASFELPLKSHGIVFFTKTEKTSTPKFPKEFTGDPR
jgi:hypothetical protein